MRVKTLFAAVVVVQKPIVRKQNAVLAFVCFNTSALCVSPPGVESPY